jgi:hypothetical protein
MGFGEPFSGGLADGLSDSHRPPKLIPKDSEEIPRQTHFEMELAYFETYSSIWNARVSF